jgi:hypothetical protein
MKARVLNYDNLCSKRLPEPTEYMPLNFARFTVDFFNQKQNKMFLNVS